MPPYKRQLEEVVTGYDAELKGQVREDDRSIHVGKMVGDIYGDAPIQTMRVNRGQLRAADPNDRSSPAASDRGLGAAGFIPQRGQQRKATEEGRGKKKKRCAEAKAHQPLCPRERLRSRPESTLFHWLASVKIDRTAPTR